MALGTLTEQSTHFTLEILASATATNGVPSGASAGARLDDIGQQLQLNRGIVKIVSTAGSDTMSVTIRLWGYCPTAAEWIPLGSGADADKGKLNESPAGTYTALGEVDTDQILHAEPVEGLWGFTRIYAQIAAISGTSTAVTGWLSVPKQGAKF